jgi:hypothetical protein
LRRAEGKPAPYSVKVEILHDRTTFKASLPHLTVAMDA